MFVRLPMIVARIRVITSVQRSSATSAPCILKITMFRKLYCMNFVLSHKSIWNDLISRHGTCYTLPLYFHAQAHFGPYCSKPIDSLALSSRSSFGTRSSIAAISHESACFRNSDTRLVLRDRLISRIGLVVPGAPYPPLIFVLEHTDPSILMDEHCRMAEYARSIERAQRREPLCMSDEDPTAAESRSGIMLVPECMQPS